MATEPTGLAVEGIRFSFGGGREVLSGLSVEVPPSEVLSLVGPSGCGKTTLLRVVAGLEVPEAGVVRIGGRTVTGPGELVPPERRRVGMVFQDWALFPHLSVAGNVGFGLPRGSRGDAGRIDRTLSLVGLEGLGDRMPSTLSGGQQQRVALGRALAQEPEVLLLDEPFSNLDASLRARVRTDVHRLLADLGVTTVMVTHDRDEAFVLGDTVALMRDGRIVQHGPAEDLYVRPVDEWAAGFLGELVALEGEADGDRAGTVLGEVALAGHHRGPVRVLVRPEQLQLADPPGAGGGPAGTAPGVPARVVLVEYHGPRTSYVLEVAGAEVAADVPGPPRWAPGAEVVVVAPEGPLPVGEGA